MGIYKTLVDVGEDSIYDLCRLTPELIGELESRGINKMQDIPDDISLNKFQSRQVEATKAGTPHVEPDMISAILGDYQYPLYFFDYETFSTSIPHYDGLTPYDQIPFQYSLHIIDKPGLLSVTSNFCMTKLVVLYKIYVLVCDPILVMPAQSLPGTRASKKPEISGLPR